MYCKRPGCRNVAVRKRRYCVQHLPRRTKPVRSKSSLATTVDTLKRNAPLVGSYDDLDLQHQHKRRRVMRDDKAPPVKIKRSGSDLTGLHLPTEQLGFPVLFIPFEGNYSTRMMGGMSKKGINQLNIQERGSRYWLDSEKFEVPFDPNGTLSSERWFSNNSDRETGFNLPSGKNKKDRLSGWSDEYENIYEAALTNAFETLRVTQFSTISDGRPELIVLSERIDAWPDTLECRGHVYVKSYELSPRSNLQKMAFYQPKPPSGAITFRTLQRKANGATETWGVVTKKKHLDYGQSVVFSVACVHLSSGLTKVTRETQRDRHLEELFEFAQTNHIDAVLGDFNLNTYGFLGGTIPLSTGVVLSDENKPRFQSTFTATSGSGERMYMGGLDISESLGLSTTLTTTGEQLIEPALMLDDERVLYSDHHAIYKNYVMTARR